MDKKEIKYKLKQDGILQVKRSIIKKDQYKGNQNILKGLSH